MSEQVYHVPALLDECIRGLDIHPYGTYVDVTFGGGGHSRAILSHLAPPLSSQGSDTPLNSTKQGHLYGFDQDLDALANAPADPRFTFVRGNFRFLAQFLRYYGVDTVDGILADLGVSFHHFDDADRGFSFRADAPLDMRMNRAAPITAAHVLNTYSDADLARILTLWGDLRRPGPIVKAILSARAARPLLTTGALLDAVKGAINPRREKAELAQVFQALRIEVNDEMRALPEMLAATIKVLRPGGRLAIITYHSLEDRLVKNFLRTGNIEGRLDKDFYGNPLTPWQLLTRQPITPSAEEVAANPRSRSAKLRIAIRKSPTRG